jgi:hypothetical protein
MIITFEILRLLRNFGSRDGLVCVSLVSDYGLDHQGSILGMD